MIKLCTNNITSVVAQLGIYSVYTSQYLGICYIHMLRP